MRRPPRPIRRRRPRTRHCCRRIRRRARPRQRWRRLKSSRRRSHARRRRFSLPRQRQPRRRQPNDAFKSLRRSLTSKTMPLHLIKLAVGCESVKELKSWVAQRMLTAKQKGLPRHHIHITRMTPKRGEELLSVSALFLGKRGEISDPLKHLDINNSLDRGREGDCRW